MTILVIGATGTVGREVVAQLVAAGKDVRATTRQAARARQFLRDRVDLIEADVTAPSGVRNALEGVDGVIVTVGGDADPEGVYTAAPPCSPKPFPAEGSPSR